MNDSKKLELEDAATEDEESSFAKWLPPALSAESLDAPPAATLTGLGPLSAAPSEEGAILAPSEGDGPEKSQAVALVPDEPAFVPPADVDDEDEPTQIITNLFPDLVPKRSSPGGSGPLTRTLLLGAPLPSNIFHEPPPEAPEPEPEEDAETAQLLGNAANDDTVEILEGPEAEAAVELISDGPESERQNIEHAATQQAELLAAMVEGANRLVTPLRYTADPVLRESQVPPPPKVELLDAGLPLLAPPEVPSDANAPAAPMFPPSVQVLSERERPTVPAQRRPLERTAPAGVETGETLRAAGSSLSEPPWAQTVRPRTTSRTALRYAVGAFALSALATVLILRAILPGKGSVVVSAVGVNGVPVSNAQVLVDGLPACSPAPCAAKLREGRHVVTVSAAGYKAAAERSVDVAPGSEANVQVALTPVAGTGSASLHVRVQARGLRVYLDGEDRGEAPLSLGGLEPTEHTIRLAGSPFYAPFEQKLTLEPNANFTLSPSLVPRQAAIVITAGPAADGARIEVLGSKEPKLVTELPARIEVPLLGSYTVRASRTGYQTLELPVRFAEGEFEKQVRIGLSPDKDKAAEKDKARELPVVLEDAPATPPPVAPAPAGQGSLSVSSVPPVNVIVDGRPLGAAPKKLQLPAGNHTVVFVHPTLGRKSVSVKVEPGKDATASVKY